MAFRERLTSFFKVFILTIGINILKVLKTVWTLYRHSEFAVFYLHYCVKTLFFEKLMHLTLTIKQE